MKRITNMRPGGVLVALAAIAALLLAACGGSSNGGGSASNSAGLSKATGATSGAPLTVNASAAPVTLDPTEAGIDTEVGWISSLYSTLTQPAYEPGPIAGVQQAKLGPTAVKPYLAQSWQFSDNDRTLTFHLHPGLKFPSGDPVDAQAVKFSIERALKVGAGGDAVMQETQFKPALFKSVETPNSLTVVIHYSRPAPNQPGVFASPQVSIYDPKLVEEHGGVAEGKPNTWLASHDAGYGAYLLKSYTPGHQLVLEANPNFFEPAKSKKVVINFIPDNETLLLDAKSGAADVTLGISDQAAHALQGNSCCTVVAASSRRGMFVNLPDFGKVPVFDNAKSRAALAYAVPYEAILKKVAYGYGQLYFGEWQPSYSFYNATVGKAHEYNLEKAKQLMKESGVPTPASVTFYYPIGEIVDGEIATAIAGSWQQVGVNAKVKPIAVSQFFEQEKKYAGASIELEGPEIVAPAYFWAYDLQCEPANPDGASICLHEADKLMTEVQDGAFIDDPAKEQQVLDEVDEMYIKATGKIWIYNAKMISVLGKDMTSYYSSDLPQVRFWEKQ